MLLNNLSADVAAGWDDMHRYSPAPRHRRKMILKILSKINFDTCLDAGCAQGYLLQQIIAKFPSVKGHGCDLSPLVIEDNKTRFPECTFNVVDIEKNTWPEPKQFDVVICTEVIEHISDWKSAVQHLANMSKHYLLVTVPGGKIRAIDKKVGHYRHFSGDDLVAEIETHGFSCEPIVRQGFPVHSLYKKLINAFAPEEIYAAFSGEKKYSFMQKSISNALYYLFHINYFFNRGEQIFILAKKL